MTDYPHLNIYCLLWLGDFRGRNYTEADVHRLHALVENHCPYKFKFHCLTNSMSKSLPGTVIPLKYPDKWPGWWAKIECFNPNLEVTGSLYFDLDITLVNSIQPLVECGGYYSNLMLFDTKSPGRPQDREKEETEKGLFRRYQASVMKWNPRSVVTQEIYKQFVTNSDKIIAKYRSEQDVYGDWYPNLDMFRDKWMMKLDAAKKTPKKPKDLIVITGHSEKNDFRETGVPWIDKEMNL